MEAFLGALVGAFGGLIIAALTPWFKYSFILNEKIAEKRITAHESVMNLASEMRVTSVVNDQSGILTRCPVPMLSQESFDQWQVHIYKTTAPGRTWLSEDVRRELDFLQNYFYNLMNNVSGVSDEIYQQIGVILYQDFMDITDSLEQVAYKYFQKGLHVRKNRDLSSNKEYQQWMEARLLKTNLFTKDKEIKALLTV